ncbi:MAG: hypothetical protein HY727_11350 [Candidatus Rokubacteria bacterium]|nr:hypothetical protein [Candidatus Rokubacteria bacterium]
MIARGCRPAVVLVLLLVAAPATADLLLPPGFSVQVYVTGDGFDSDAARGVRGIPATSTVAFDHAGNLYLARTGRRYLGGEVEDLWPIYRIPVGGARLRPDTEGSYFHGPPLPNPQVAAIRAGREILVTTFDRERKVGVVYRMLDGRAELLAGGTPPRGRAPLLTQPEGVAADAAGSVYVADRDRGVIVRLDAGGRVLDPRYVSVARPRVLAVDDKDRLWIGSDGAAEAPWQRGPGEIWRVGRQGVPSVVLNGPVVAGLALGPDGHPFVADRHAGKIFFITAEGRAAEFAGFTDGDAPRGLCFAPATPETRRAGIAGDLFVVTISRGAWPVNEIIRISGPFDELVRKQR